MPGIHDIMMNQQPLPTWLHLIPKSNELIGLPTNFQVGLHQITVVTKALIPVSSPSASSPASPLTKHFFTIQVLNQANNDNIEARSDPTFCSKHKLLVGLKVDAVEVLLKVNRNTINCFKKKKRSNQINPPK